MGNGPFYAKCGVGMWLYQDELDYAFFRKILESEGRKVPEELGCNWLQNEWDTLDGSCPSPDLELRGWYNEEMFPDMQIMFRRPCLWNTYKFHNLDDSCFALFIMPKGFPEGSRSYGFDSAEPVSLSKGEVVDLFSYTDVQLEALSTYVATITNNPDRRFEPEVLAFIDNNESVC